MELLLRNVSIVPLEAGPRWTRPVSVLISGGSVAEIGHDLERPVGVEEVDASGRWLIPGIWDQHVHLGMWTRTSRRLDVAGTNSVREVLERVAGRLASAPGAPLIGYGQRPLGWPVEPTVAALDSVSSGVPVILVSGDSHHAWLNSAALNALGLPLRDGMVEENEWYAAYPRVMTLVGEGADPADYLTSMQAAAALGVVGVVDFEYGEDLAAWRERWAGGADLIRVRRSTYQDGLGETLEAGLATGSLLLPESSKLTMGPLKIISDGSLNTRTAWCCSPYGDGSGSGAANQSSAELRELLRTARRGGLEVAVHAIGDAACHDALAGFRETGARGSVEHAQLMTRADVSALAELGLRASVQPAHLLDDRDITELVWGDRADRCFPLRWMIDDGVDLALGSDAPVAPLDPWLAMAAAVYRSGDEREPWHPEQALTPREALAASVDGVGSVRAGMAADLVLLDADPLGADLDPKDQAERLRTMPVSATFIDGELVHGEW